MNNQDYEKAKVECYRDLWDVVLCKSPIANQIIPDNVFAFIFDRAYRLGMEAAKKDMLTANVDSLSSNVDSLEGKHTEPKFNVGEVCKSIYADELVTITEVIPPSNKGNARYKVKEYPYLWDECELKPHPKLEGVYHFDNIVKAGFRSERRLNIATQILCALLSNPAEENVDVYRAYNIADALIRNNE